MRHTHTVDSQSFGNTGDVREANVMYFVRQMSLDRPLYRTNILEASRDSIKDK